jgi:hypothetical protein
VTAVYTLAPDRSLLFTVRGDVTHYLNQQSGAPNKGSGGAAVLVGIDFAADAILRARALIGYAARRFDSPAFANQDTVIFEGTLIWTPTELTTVTTSLVRNLQDAAQETLSGYVYSGARVDIDHELRRNLVLSVHGGAQAAQYQQSSQNQTLATAGARVSWWLNNHVRLGASYDFTAQITGPQPGYAQNVVLLSVGLGL